MFFLDADDYLHADTCLKCFEFLQKDEQGFDFIMFNLLAQDSKNGDFTLRRVVNKSQITDTHGFEALYFGKDTNFYNVATKCIRKSTYLKAIAFAEVKEKILVAEDILASMALLGVSKRIALLDEALYYYRFNEGSATRAKDKKQERVDDLNLVISYFERLATKGDRAYEIFIQGLILVLHGHIFGNEMELLSDLYQARLASGCPKFIAKLLLSSGKKRHFKGQDKTLKRRLREFVEENKDVFLGES